jgi:hypothetical protein
MKMQRDEPIFSGNRMVPEPLVREQAPAPPASMDVDTVTRVPKKPKVDTGMRDSLIELLTLLEVLGSWDRFKRGYRPANDKLHDVIEKIKKVI